MSSRVIEFAKKGMNENATIERYRNCWSDLLHLGVECLAFNPKMGLAVMPRAQGNHIDTCPDLALSDRIWWASR